MLRLTQLQLELHWVSAYYAGTVCVLPKASTLSTTMSFHQTTEKRSDSCFELRVKRIFRTTEQIRWQTDEAGSNQMSVFPVTVRASTEMVCCSRRTEDLLRSVRRV